jgi:chromate reductase
MRILTISGSLRARSTNTSLLRSLPLIADPASSIVFYEELSSIPAFNPDLERDHQFSSVSNFQRILKESDVVVISTPEYAHGLPGALKNVLDWVVGSGELSDKCVVLLNASSRAVYAQAALRQVLSTMNAVLRSDLELTVDLPRRDMAPEDIAADHELASKLRGFIGQLLSVVPRN